MNINILYWIIVVRTFASALYTEFLKGLVLGPMGRGEGKRERRVSLSRTILTDLSGALWPRLLFTPHKHTDDDDDNNIIKHFWPSHYSKLGRQRGIVWAKGRGVRDVDSEAAIGTAAAAKVKQLLFILHCVYIVYIIYTSYTYRVIYNIMV